MHKATLADYVSSSWIRWIAGVLLVLCAVITVPQWWPTLNRWMNGVVAGQRTGARATHDAGDSGAHDASSNAHPEDGHDHAAHEEVESLELSPQALRNLGLTDEYLQPVTLTDFYRTVTIPGIVVAKPGRTNIHVSSPMDGIIQHVHAVSGEAVVAGELLFVVRLTYEDLVESQTRLLKDLADLEVEQREIDRLEEVTRSGAVASKLLLERQYAKQRLESSIAAQRAALKLHGLSDEQIDMIIREKRLLRDLSIVAPHVDEHDHDHEDEQNDLRLSERQVQPVAYLGQIDGLEIPAESEPKFLIVEQLNASKGQGVKAGEMLSSLSDYSTLYIEGKAFEQDAPAIAEVAGRGWPIEAVISTASGEETLPALQLTYVANVVDPQSRTLSFFVNLPNSIIRDETNQEGQRFITWKYRAGQRLDVRVPVELWEQQIVLPVDAAVKDGADWFVFQQNGDHFDRIPVHVVHRDQQSLVIANDGAIFPGDIVARRSAHQMQMALKNKSGTGADPHAGHNH